MLIMQSMSIRNVDQLTPSETGPKGCLTFHSVESKQIRLKLLVKFFQDFSRLLLSLESKWECLFPLYG
jgi:hypothetical protein